MTNQIKRIEIFNDTLDWIKNDKVLAASVDWAKKHTTVYYEDDYPKFDAAEKYDTEISVTRHRSYEAAFEIYKNDSSAHIAVMNFANAFQAGGGVKTGAGAQEECLCRTSTLYPLLYRKTLRDSFYKHHQALKSPKATDSLIYTRGVVVCKTDEDFPERLPEEEWINVDVITIAAPDLRTSSNVHMALTGKGIAMQRTELFGYHVKRAIHMLTVAAAKGSDTLVLGAFGCGAFHNDPEVVARAYKVAIGEFPKVFKRIEFAVYCPPGNDRNYEVFKKILE